MKRSRIRIRQAHLSDVPLLVELNRKAYPTMAQDNVIWGESHLRSHQRVFPEGQLVAVLEGRIVGAAASLIVDLSRDPNRPHTWAGITDSGYFHNHNPEGDTLYGADVYVDPDCHRMGVGSSLYEARRKLCQKFNLRRILAGGRLVKYHHYRDQISPEEYAERVVKGEIKDPVLTFQLRHGFELRGVLSNYLHDTMSCNFASQIEWLNPKFKAKPSAVRKVRVSCVQYQMRKVTSFEDFARQVTYFVDIASDYGSDFLLMPELFSVQLLSQTSTLTPQEGIRELTAYTKPFVKLMTSLAKRYDLTIISGSHPVKRGKDIWNISHICLPSGRVVEQPKLHITPNERKWWGITGGDQLAVIDTPAGKIGVLICYDVEFPEAARYLADQGAEIIFVPFCTDNRQGYMRVRYCAQARAIENQVYVALAGNVGNLPDVVNMDVQYGQAAVLTPCDFAFARDGIAAEADSNEETILVCDLDLDDLHEARHSGTVTPRLDRRPDLFLARHQFKDMTPLEYHLDEGPLGDQPKFGG